MPFIYSPKDCQLTGDEIRDLERRMSDTTSGGVVTVSATEMDFLKTQDCGFFAENTALRDEFAKAALQGPLADSEYGLGSVGMANRCYDIADAMMAERSKRRDGSSD